MVCILGMGSCGNKSSSAFTTNVSLINQAMTNMVTNTSSSTSVTTFNSQSNNITVLPPKGYDYRTWGPLVKGCTQKNEQTMDSSQRVSVSLDVSSTKNLQKQISNALTAQNDKALKQKSDFLQTASNVSDTATTVNQAISNLVATNISDSVTNSLKVLLTNAQKNKFTMYGPVECTKENPYLSTNTQKLVSSQIVDTITKALTSTTLKDVMATTSDIKNKEETEQEGKGLSSLIDSVFKGISGIFSSVAFAIIAPIIAIVIIIAILMFVFKGSISKIAEKKAGVSFGKWLFGRKRVRGRR
jgi:hypothetical protein